MRALPFLLGLLFVGAPCFRQVTETDAGWHLATGRLIATSGVPFQNALTWSAPDAPYYATSWLYDWIGGALTQRLGVAGLQGFTFALVALTLFGLALSLDRIDPLRGVWMVPLVALMMMPRITERPHVASWALLVFVLWLCIGSGADWRRRLLCVPLVALASNFHSGAAFPAVAVLFFCVEAFIREWREKRELVIGVAGLVALLANPGGFLNLQYLAENIHVRTVINIIEMEPPSPGTSPLFFIALPIGLYAAWRGRRRSVALLGTTVLFALLALRAVRFAIDFEIVAAMAVTQALATTRVPWLRWFPVVAAVGLLAAALPTYAAVRFGPSFDERQFPVRAASFIATEHIQGRMFNAFRDGGFLEWALPDQHWFQDGRVQAFPPAFFLREQSAESSLSGWSEWIHDQGVEWALTSRFQEHMTGNTLFEGDEWALVYWDETSEVRLRRDIERFAPIITAHEYRHFRPNGPVPVSTADRIALVEWDEELRRFEETSPRYAPAFVIHCAVRTRIGNDSASVCDHAATLADTDQLRTSLAQVRSLRPAP